MFVWCSLYTCEMEVAIGCLSLKFKMLYFWTAATTWTILSDKVGYGWAVTLSNLVVNVICRWTGALHQGLATSAVSFDSFERERRVV